MPQNHMRVLFGKICEPIFSFPDDVPDYYAPLTLRKPGLTHLIGI
jgi:hypothetical protein